MQQAVHLWAGRERVPPLGLMLAWLLLSRVTDARAPGWSSRGSTPAFGLLLLVLGRHFLG
jgi:hypothetical protein